jgi:hypothetical protein
MFEPKKYKLNQENKDVLDLLRLDLMFLKKNLKALKSNFIILSFLPCFIKKLENLSKGNSKFRVFKDELFLKQTGTSIILFIKNFIKEEFRIYK